MASHIYLMMLYVNIGRPLSDRFVKDALYSIQDCNRSNTIIFNVLNLLSWNHWVLNFKFYSQLI